MIEGISFILLAYKEEENLRKILPLVKQNAEITGENFEIIVVDTESPLDNTIDVCKANGAIYINQKYPGFGGAFRTGIETASRSNIITIDSDGAHNPKYIPTMVKLYRNNNYDVVIGSRYVKGGGTNDPFINVLMSKVLNGIYSIVFKLKIRDLSTNFRMYKTSDLKPVDLECLNYDVLQEVLIKMRLNNSGELETDEFPIVLEKRISGKSKRKLFKFIASYINTLISLKHIERKYTRHNH